MFRRVLLALGGVFLTLVAGIGVEIFLAMRRDYLPTEPAIVIEGTFGEGRPLRFVVLGDSTAAGLGTDEAHAYPTLLAEMLAADGYRVELTGLGVSGARVADVLAEQVPVAISLDPDLIFIGIGANDATHLTRLSDIEADMTSIIERIVDDGTELVVAGAPDMRARAFHEPLRSLVGYRGRRVTATIEATAERSGIPSVPLARLTGPFFAEDPDAHYARDDFHPGRMGYARWADAIFPYLVDALK